MVRSANLARSGQEAALLPGRVAAAAAASNNVMRPSCPSCSVGQHQCMHSPRHPLESPNRLSEVSQSSPGQAHFASHHSRRLPSPPAASRLERPQPSIPTADGIPGCQLPLLFFDPLPSSGPQPAPSLILAPSLFFPAHLLSLLLFPTPAFLAGWETCALSVIDCQFVAFFSLTCLSSFFPFLFTL